MDVLIDTRLREFAVAAERIAAALEQIANTSSRVWPERLARAVQAHLDDPTSQAKIIEVMHYLPTQEELPALRTVRAALAALEAPDASV